MAEVTAVNKLGDPLIEVIVIIFVIGEHQNAGNLGRLIAKLGFVGTAKNRFKPIDRVTD